MSHPSKPQAYDLSHAFSTGLLSLSGKIDVHCLAKLLQMYRQFNICVFSITLDADATNEEIQHLTLQYDGRECNPEFSGTLSEYLTQHSLVLMS